MTQLQIHDVEKIVLEDGESENYTWVRIYFHRRNREVIEVVAHPAQGRDTLRVEQPDDPEADTLVDRSLVDGSVEWETPWKIVPRNPADGTAAKARAAALEEVLRIPQVSVGGTEGYISIKAVRRLAAKTAGENKE